MGNKIRLIMFVFLWIFTVSYSQEILDQAIPGTNGAGIAIHVAAGNHNGDFHITYEKSGIYYRYYNGQNWESAIKITGDAPFRSGAHIAVDRNNNPHFVWGNSGCHYTKITDNQVQNQENIPGTGGWNQCDIAISYAGRILVASNSGTHNKHAVFELLSNGSWQKIHDLPVGSDGRWAPNITTTRGGIIYVATRSRNGSHNLLWNVIKDGKVSENYQQSGHWFEPNGIAIGESFAAAALDGGHFIHASPTNDGPHYIYYTKIGAATGRLRGALIGLGMTSGNTLYASYSNQGNSDINDRTIRPSHSYYYSISKDTGKTWETNKPVTTDASGQGHGSMAVNGNWIMFAWPDMREGLHVRYSLMLDTNVVPGSGIAVLDAVVIDNFTINLIFSMDVQENSATTLTNYFLGGIGKVDSAVVQDGNQVMLYLNTPLGSPGTDTLLIQNVEATNGARLSAYTKFGLTPSTAIEFSNSEESDALRMENFPNPFNPGTTIYFHNLRGALNKIEIVNSGGIVLFALENYRGKIFEWQAKDARGGELPAGVYFLRVQKGSKNYQHKMTLMR